MRLPEENFEMKKDGGQMRKILKICVKLIDSQVQQIDSDHARAAKFGCENHMSAQLYAVQEFE